MARREALALLWALYFVQGLPFGFQATALPVILRERGASLTMISLAGALAAPWLLKPLWSPLVDRYHLPRLGRRRSWLLPMQLLLSLSMLAAAAVGTQGLLALAVVVLVMNLFAATLDIAVDGLAVDVLRRTELGHGNTAQVVGYKLGMLSGGGLLLWASPRLGDTGVFVAMAATAAVVFALTLAFREPPAAVAEPLPARMADVLGTLRRAVASGGGLWLLVVVATYKLGESVADAMFKPFVLDAGFAKDQIGLWIGSYGMLASIAGSVAGGALATRMPFVRAVALAAALRVLPLCGQLWLSTQADIAPAHVVAITCAEHFCGGALTTAMFALMMSRTDRRVGASHFTLLAAVEVLGKVPPSLAAGAIADALGYTPLFGAAVALSLLFLPLLTRLR